MPRPGCCCADCNDNCIDGTRPQYLVATVFGIPDITATPFGGTTAFYRLSQYNGEFKLVNVYPGSGPYNPAYPQTWCYRYVFTAADDNPIGCTGLALHFRSYNNGGTPVSSWKLSWYRDGFQEQYTTTHVGNRVLGSLAEDYNCRQEFNGSTSTVGAFFWFGQTPAPEGWATIAFQ